MHGYRKVKDLDAGYPNFHYFLVSYLIFPCIKKNWVHKSEEEGYIIQISFETEAIIQNKSDNKTQSQSIYLNEQVAFISCWKNNFISNLSVKAKLDNKVHSCWILNSFLTSHLLEIVTITSQFLRFPIN